MRKLFVIICVLVIAACGEQKAKKPLGNLQKSTEVTAPAKKATGIPIVIVPGLTILEEATGVPSTQVFISSPSFPELIFLISDYGCSQVAAEEVRRLKIPMDAKFLFKSVYEAKGTYYYGLVEEGRVALYSQAMAKGTAAANQESNSFDLIQEFDIKNRKPLDGFFICYQEDKDKSKKMSIYFDKDGMANSIKFKNQSDWIPLQYNTSQVDKGGAEPITVDQFFEISAGNKSAILNLTHSGNLDYASYVSTLDGKELKFTIEQDLTIVDGTYRKQACY